MLSRKVIKGKKADEEFIMSNAPYKRIINDAEHVITKCVTDIKEDDLVAHKVDKEVDANLDVFAEDLHKKEMEKEQVNDQINIDFHVDKHETHKKNFEYKMSFIKSATMRHLILMKARMIT